MEPQLKDQKECDGGAGCTSCACDCQLEINYSLSLLIVNVSELLPAMSSDGLGGCILAVLRWNLS